MKLIAFLVLLMLYPLFLKLLQISDLRAIPLIVPYALAVLSVVILIFEVSAFVVKLWKR
ncbi:hypothetical protein [Paenibacillus sp. YYML68]|uniref:hypothetical protein n=1 Tax=Paenibacillus sp. YYML68 TaxID=2909250 RepID=UPI0024912450|nr:hypothetical protein [Paenibacillus sp. YYML68]